MHFKFRPVINAIHSKFRPVITTAFISVPEGSNLMSVIELHSKRSSPEKRYMVHIAFSFPLSPRSVAVDAPRRRLCAGAAPVGVDGRVGGDVGRRPVRPGGEARRRRRRHEAPLLADAILRDEALRVDAAAAAADQGVAVARASPLRQVAAPSATAAAARGRRRRVICCRGNQLSRLKSEPFFV